jgi:hypothetical protein
VRPSRRHGSYLGIVDDALENFEHTVLQQRGHFLRQRDFQHSPHGGTGMNKAFDLLADQEQLVQADAAFVAGVAASRAAFGAVKRKLIALFNAQSSKGVSAIAARQRVVFFFRRMYDSLHSTQSVRARR